MKKTLFVILSVLSLVQSGGFADEISTAKTQLQTQLSLIKQITPFVERHFKARLQLLKQRTTATLQLVEEKGIAHRQTDLAYQNLIVSYLYSVAFFREIETDVSVEWIKELLQITEQIKKSRGYDEDSPYTQITYTVFNQIHQLIHQLKNNNALSEELNQKLQALVPELGKLLAIAKQGGDRPNTFEAARPLYDSIVALYPEFNKILQSNTVFNVVLEIQGLTEFYAEYAQIKK